MMQRTDHPVEKPVFEKLPDEDIKELEQIRESALRILDYAENTTGDLIRKLLRKGYDREKTERIIRDLTRAGLLDDRRFAEHYARMKLESGKGSLWIRKKLAEKGVSREIAEEAVNLAAADDRERIRCLKKALQLLELQDLFEVDDEGKVIFSEETAEWYEYEDVFLYHCSEECSRHERYQIGEKEKARLMRRLASSGFSAEAVRYTVRTLNQL